MGVRQRSRHVSLRLSSSCPAVVLGVVTAGCGGSASGAADDTTVATPRQGGTYNYPLQVDPGAFDPSIPQVGDGYAVLHQLYEGLVRYEEQPDGTMKTVPCLAESWSGSADATVWTFRLRRGVLFQAPVSREVTAADVVADLRYLADPVRESAVTYMLAPLEGTTGRLCWRRRLGVRLSTATPSASRSSTPSPSSPTPWATRLSGSGRRTTCGRWASRPCTAPVGTGPYLFLKRSPARPSTWSATPSGGTRPAGRTSTPSTTRCSAASLR